MNVPNKSVGKSVLIMLLIFVVNNTAWLSPHLPNKFFIILNGVFGAVAFIWLMVIIGDWIYKNHED